MDPNELTSKLAAARTAMTNSNTAYPKTLADLRKKNLTPTLTESNFSTDPALLEKRKAEARRAMETPDQKKRREAYEATLAQETLTQKRVAELKAAREALERKHREESGNADIQAEKERVEAQRKYQQKVEEAKVRIDEITRSNIGPSNIRTLENDLLHEVKSPDFSMTKHLIDQRKNGGSRPPNPNSNKNFLALILILVLIAGGAGGLFFAFYITKHKTTTVTPILLNKLIFTDLTTKINIDQKTKEDVLTDISNNRRDNDGDLVNIFLLKNTNQAEQVTEGALSREAWFNFLSINPTVSFNHFLTTEANFGLSNNGTSSVWFVFKTRSYEHTFDSLLREGRNIATSLYTPFLNSKDIMDFQIATQKESIIKNIDVQIWRTASSTVLVYGFVDKETLIIAQNEDTFNKLLEGYFGKR